MRSGEIPALLFLGIDGKASPGMTVDDFATLVDDGMVVLTFTDQTACNAVYDRIVGDDGPTQANSYDGPVKVYAFTCDDMGEGRSENT